MEVQRRPSMSASTSRFRFLRPCIRRCGYNMACTCTDSCFAIHQWDLRTLPPLDCPVWRQQTAPSRSKKKQTLELVGRVMIIQCSCCCCLKWIRVSSIPGGGEASFLNPNQCSSIHDSSKCHALRLTRFSADDVTRSSSKLQAKDVTLHKMQVYN